ncbi:MAG: FAD:protein FMN transferase [Calditrichia bacterium]
MRIYIKFIGGLLLLGLFACQANDPQNNLKAFYGQTMGTTYTVKVVTTADTSGLKQRMDQALESVNDAMSTYRDSSEITLLNRSQDTTFVQLSADLFFVMQRAQEINRLSDGALDMTVGPLVNLWGFGTQGSRTKTPDEAQITERRDYVGSDKIVLQKEKRLFRKTHPLSVCDLSAIAKGFGVDKLAELLDDRSFDNYYVEVGGEIRTKGHNAFGMIWRVGIANPGGGDVEKIVPLPGMSMATSGDYLNYFEENGVRYSHTINPVTGMPITHRLASVTVVHESCTMADGFATAISVLGPEKGIVFANENNLAIYMITRTDSGFESKMNRSFEQLLALNSGKGK